MGEDFHGYGIGLFVYVLVYSKDFTKAGTIFEQGLATLISKKLGYKDRKLPHLKFGIGVSPRS
jgi:hypothetical protein